MRVFMVIAVAFVFFSASTIAIENCKCQDANGQYNSVTNICCIEQVEQGTSELRYPGKNHQCYDTDWFTYEVDGTEFDNCCKLFGIGGAFCWGHR